MAPKNTPPMGFRFRPTDHEVFTLLDKLVKGGQLPSYYPIVERTLFGEKPPWYVLNDHDPWEHIIPEGNNDSSEKKTLFVFTKLVSLGKSRAVRSSACGTWDGKSANNKIKNKDKVVIGHKKYYTFKPKNNITLEETKIYGKWMMHEYSFPNDKSGSVLCKITVDGGSRVCVDEGLCGKRKLSSTSLDDDDRGSRKVCKGSGSWSAQETVMEELDECQQVYDVSCSLAGSNHDRKLQYPSIKDKWEVLNYSGGMLGQQIIQDYDVSCPLAGSNHDQTLQDPSIKDKLEVLNSSGGMLGQQIIQDYNGLENSAFATGYDCSIPIMQQPECQQQVKEILVGSTRDDIVKESHSATTSVGYSMTSTWCAGSSSSSTIIDQLQQGIREEMIIPDDCIPEMCGGSESETGRISVTAELGEIGTANDDFDPLSCIDFDEDIMFKIPSYMDEWEIHTYSGGMQGLLVDDNCGLGDLLFGTRSNLDEAENRFLLD